MFVKWHVAEKIRVASNLNSSVTKDKLLQNWTILSVRYDRCTLEFLALNILVLLDNFHL